MATLVLINFFLFSPSVEIFLSQPQFGVAFFAQNGAIQKKLFKLLRLTIADLPRCGPSESVRELFSQFRLVLWSFIKLNNLHFRNIVSLHNLRFLVNENLVVNASEWLHHFVKVDFAVEFEKLVVAIPAITSFANSGRWKMQYVIVTLVNHISLIQALRLTKQLEFHGWNCDPTWLVETGSGVFGCVLDELAKFGRSSICSCLQIDTCE